MIVAIAICAPLPFSYVAVYLGLFMCSVASTNVCIRRWRATIRFDAAFALLMSTAYFPTVIWSIMAGTLKSHANRSSSYFVVMLLMAATTTQLLCVAFAVWLDSWQIIEYSYQQQQQQQQQATTSNPASVPPPQSTLSPLAATNLLVIKCLLAMAFVLLFIFLGVFTATVSLPLGMAFYLLAVSSLGYALLKLHVLRLSSSSSSSSALVVSLKQFYNTHTSLVFASIGVFVALCGLVGAASRPSQAFW